MSSTKKQHKSRHHRGIGATERVARQQHRQKEKKEVRGIRKHFKAIKRCVFGLLPRDEVERLARECGFYKRKPRAIQAFDFVLCCSMAAMAEGKRGFASVWRLLAAAVGVKVARSAVTQRFGAGSASLFEELFARVVQRLPEAQCPEYLGKLERFRKVLAHDGSVIKLAPVLKKLFPATRTNTVDAAGKLHATADLIGRRIEAVKWTGERDSELEVAREQGVEPGVLYLGDLGYTCYDYFAQIKAGGAELLWRLKDNANPKIVRVRHGIIAPVSAAREQLGLNDDRLRFTKSHDTFDVDARFETDQGAIELRVVGCYNDETGKYHCYVTTLSCEDFSPDELAVLYSRRWIIELLYKLLKSSCHLDHVETGDPEAVRTHIYASLLGAVFLTSLSAVAAEQVGIQSSQISPLVVGIAAPLLVMPLMLLWCNHDLRPEDLASAIIRTLSHGCRDQNACRTRRKWGALGL
jgi:putative transposase